MLERSSRRDRSTMEVKRYTIGREERFSCAVNVLSSEKGVLLIDAGHYSDELARALRELGGPDAILLTHGHWDHIYALDEIKRDYPDVPVYLNKIEKDFLTDPHLNASDEQPFRVKVQSEVQPITEGIHEIGGYSIQVCNAPGHTVGSCYFHLPSEKILFMGDVIISTGASTTHRPTGSYEDMLATAAKLAVNPLPADTQIYFGHEPSPLGWDALRRTNALIGTTRYRKGLEPKKEIIGVQKNKNGEIVRVVTMNTRNGARATEAPPGETNALSGYPVYCENMKITGREAIVLFGRERRGEEVVLHFATAAGKLMEGEEKTFIEKIERVGIRLANATIEENHEGRCVHIKQSEYGVGDEKEDTMTVNEANSVTGIAQLVVRERQSRVRNRREELGACFFPDATVTTSWTSSSVQTYLSGAQSREEEFTKPIVNRLGPPVVHLKGNRAVVELPSTTTRWIDVNGAEAVLVSFMRLIYRVECRNGIWKIVNMTAVNECDTLEPAIPGADLHIEPNEVENLRISYRYLAYTRMKEGENVSQELFGVDRPEQVDKLYAEAFAWRDGR